METELPRSGIFVYEIWLWYVVFIKHGLTGSNKESLKEPLKKVKLNQISE